MKKYVLFLFLLPISLFAQQWNTSAVKLGTFIPSASGAGFIVGYEGGHFFEPQFSLGWSIDWFHSNFTDSKAVNDFNLIDPPPPGTSGSTNELRAQTNINDFPIMGLATVRFPVTPLSDIYINGGIGFEALFVDYTNYQNTSQNDFKTAFDFNWSLGVGGTYGFGKRSEVFAEIGYHSSAPSWDYQITDNLGYKHTYQRTFDMSGMLMRLGVRFYY